MRDTGTTPFYLMSNTFVEFPLDKNLTAYVFILPPKSPETKYRMEDLSVQSFSKNDFLCYGNERILTKRLGTKAYASVPCTILFFIVKNPQSTITNFDLTITPESDFKVIIAGVNESFYDQKEMHIQIQEIPVGYPHFTIPFMIKSESCGFLQLNFKGQVYVDQKKVHIARKFGMESTLPFHVSSKCKHIEGFNYMLELSIFNLMPFQLPEVYYAFKANSTLPKEIPKTLFDKNIQPLTTVKKMIPIEGTPDGPAVKKFGKFSLWWKVPNSFLYQYSVPDEPVVDYFEQSPDYFVFKVIQTPNRCVLNEPFTFTVEGMNVSPSNLSFTCHAMSGDGIYPVAQSIDQANYAVNASEIIQLTFAVLPIREGLVPLPTIRFVLNNSATFDYTPEAGVLVHSQ